MESQSADTLAQAGIDELAKLEKSLQRQLHDRL
jgi:hypothetical protein